MLPSLTQLWLDFHSKWNILYGMAPTKNRLTDGKAEIAETTIHLVHPTSGGQPLCGVRAPSAMIGSYVEHLDTTSTAPLKSLIADRMNRPDRMVLPDQMESP